MKAVSLAVSESDYETFRRAAERDGISMAHLIREAMATYRMESLQERTRLTDFPVLVGHRPLVGLPTRGELSEEITADSLDGLR